VTLCLCGKEKTLTTEARRHREELFGIQANASSKSPEELDTLENLDADSPANWARGMVDLNKKFNLKILGGCCGTDARFISSVVNLLKSTP